MQKSDRGILFWQKKRLMRERDPWLLIARNAEKVLNLKKKKN